MLNSVSCRRRSETPQGTLQHIIGRSERLARSTQPVVRHRRCPDTPSRTPISRFERSPATPVKSPGGTVWSLDMVKFVSRLGEGSYGIVEKVRLKTDGELYALKILKPGYLKSRPIHGVLKLRFSPEDGSVFGDVADNFLCDRPSFDASDKRMEEKSGAIVQSPVPPTSVLAPKSSSRRRRSSTGIEETVSEIRPIPFNLDDEDEDVVHCDDDDDDDMQGDDEKDHVPDSPVADFTRFASKRRRFHEATHQQEIGEHENIVKIKAFWEEPDGRFCILSELCGSSLATRISAMVNRIQEKTIAKFARDLVSGLAYIHSHQIVHLDIKPANILLSRDGKSVKITDFGQAYRLGSDVNPEEGDSRYMAPELLKDIFTPAADIFSLGITLYELGTPGLELPAGGKRWEALRHDDIDFRGWKAYSDELQRLVRSMLTSDYLSRPTAAQLLQSDYLKMKNPDMM